MTSSEIWPSELRLNAGKDLLSIAFTDGYSATLSAEFLRVFSPSAEVQGHSPSQRKLESGKKHVKITSIETVGNYAVRFVFSDSHSTGIFSWEYLREIASKHDEMWSGYLAELEAAGRTRET